MPKKKSWSKGQWQIWDSIPQRASSLQVHFVSLKAWNSLPSSQSTIYITSEALQLQIKWEVLVPEFLNYFYNERWQQRDQWCYAGVKIAEVRNCQIFCYILLILYSGLLLAISHSASVSTPSTTNHEIWDPKILLPWNGKILYFTSF